MKGGNGYRGKDSRGLARRAPDRLLTRRIIAVFKAARDIRVKQRSTGCVLNTRIAPGFRSARNWVAILTFEASQCVRNAFTLVRIGVPSSPVMVPQPVFGSQCRAPHKSSLAARRYSGTVALFYTEGGSCQVTVGFHSQVATCSPDGRLRFLTEARGGRRCVTVTTFGDQGI